MTREEAVNEIINGVRLIQQDHPFKEDVMFFEMLREAVANKDWFEVAEFCNIQIKLIEIKQQIK